MAPCYSNLGGIALRASRLCGFGLLLLLLGLASVSLLAQTNAGPARLAIIAEPGEFATIADLLTVELSAKPQLQVLERAQIEKVYREHALSAANRDYMKLGQVLGADGLLMMNQAADGTNKFLSVRLVAVKPGVVIANLRTPWPVPDAPEWARGVGNHFSPLLPKLNVSAKDAIPISVVNLRSTVRSVEAQELERQLTVLLIERLTLEPELFVLERRRMDLLGAEKDLQGMGESEFWGGSYLLDGVIDRDGYAKETVTVHAQLSPPKRVNPLPLEVRGKREKPADVVEAIAERLKEGLKLKTGASWAATDEAAKYFDESQWALKWGMLQEAQAAAESAWALGKQDLDCALVRVRAYVQAAAPDTGGYVEASVNTLGGPLPTPKAIRERIDIQQPWGLVISRRGATTRYVYVSKSPAAEAIDRSLHALTLYHQFSLMLRADEPDKKSPWYHLGIDALVAASQVLQHFQFVSESQPPVADKLVQLRALARAVAARLEQSPSVRDSYWVGDRLATHDELCYSIESGANLFRCAADWGCFWQERPEDCVALYRRLMSSAVFAYLHNSLWFRPVERPRLVAWNEEDRKRIPTVWRDYLREVDTSTNVITRIEGKFLEFADAQTDQGAETAFGAMFDLIFANRDAIISNNVELLYLQWRLGELVRGVGDYLTTPIREKLERQYASDCWPKLTAMGEAYWMGNTVRRIQLGNLASFRQQQALLAALAPHDSMRFGRTFLFREYSKEQAMELQPLLTAYKSNLTDRLAGKTGNEQVMGNLALEQVTSVEAAVQRALDPAPAPQAAAPPQATLKPPAAQPSASPTRQVTDVLPVNRFVKLPMDRLTSDRMSEFKIFAHRWREDRLWLDLRFYSKPEDGLGTHRAGLAVWNPQGNDWEIIMYPSMDGGATDGGSGLIPVGSMGEPEQGLHFEIFEGGLYLSEPRALKRFDFRTRRWERLNLPGQQLCQLYAVNKRLFAASDESIFEISEQGHATRVLASCRRRPAVSSLDSLEHLGRVTLFSGPTNTLRATVGKSVCSWNGREWTETLSLADLKRSEVFAEATLLLSAPYRRATELWLLPHDQSSAALCVRQEWQSSDSSTSGFYATLAAARSVNRNVHPAWDFPNDLSVPLAPVVYANSNLLFYIERDGVTNTPTGWEVAEKDGRHADLVCLERSSTKPLIIPIRFTLKSGWLTSSEREKKRMKLPANATTWLVCTPTQLVIGQSYAQGVWTIPLPDLQSAIARERARLVPALRPAVAQP